MTKVNRTVLIATFLIAGAAHAQPTTPTPPTPDPTSDPSAPVGTSPTTTTATSTPPSKTDGKPEQPKAGDFDAGGQVRLPNGPDAAGQFATYNWIAVDAKGRYFLTDFITVNGTVPLAVVKPDVLMDGTTHPKLIGGITARLEAKLPRMPQMPMVHYDGEVGLTLTLGYMHERAMMLSDKDYPLFTGNFTPALAAGLITKVKLSSLVDYSLTPQFFYQGAGLLPAVDGVQIPTSLLLKLGQLVQVSADLGVYTGDNFSFGGAAGGRIAGGGSLTVKLGPIVTHVGGGVASLLTGGAYPTIRDSVYLDVNVKYAK